MPSLSISYDISSQRDLHMFGMRHFGSDHEGHWAAGRGRRRHGFGFGGRHGFGGAVLERLGKIGNKIARMRRRFGRDDEDDDRRGGGLPPLVRAALENLREVTGERLASDADAEAKLVEILARAAQELKKV